MQAQLRSGCATLIALYQRMLSPYKGFRCAHAAHGGGDSCSDWIMRIVLRRPARLWLPLTLRRLRSCAMAAAALRREPYRGQRKKQRGFCCVIPVRCDLGLLRGSRQWHG